MVYRSQTLKRLVEKAGLILAPVGSGT